MSQDRIAAALQDQASVLEASFLPQTQIIEEFSQRLVEAFHQGAKLITLGSGPFGAVSGITAQLFLHKLSLERPLLPAISLSHDAILASALGGSEHSQEYFSRQLQAVASSGDVVLALGGSKRDRAMEDALETAGQLDCVTAALVPEKSTPPLPPIDFLFQLKTDSAPRATEGALFFSQLLCSLVESELFGI